MIPSFSRILNNLQSIRYGWASVGVLNQEFSIEPSQNTQETEVNVNKGSSSIKFNDTLTLQDVSYSYEVDSKSVLGQISLIIQKGETIGFLGRAVRVKALWQM